MTEKKKKDDDDPKTGDESVASADAPAREEEVPVAGGHEHHVDHKPGQK